MRVAFSKIRQVERAIKHNFIEFYKVLATVEKLANRMDVIMEKLASNADILSEAFKKKLDSEVAELDTKELKEKS